MHKRFYKLTIVLNAAVETVYAEIGTRLYPDLAVEDSANVVLRFAPGAVAAIDTSWSLPPGNPFESELSLRLLGEKGLRALEQFARCVRQGEAMPPHASGEAALHTLSVALTAYESARNQQPVSIFTNQFA